MDSNQLARSFGATLPEWTLDELAGEPDRLTELDDRMGLVHRLASRNHREGTGGPFAALVADGATGEILSIGVNLVLASSLSVNHAEVVALSLAQARLGTWDLASTGHAPVELVVNWRPCVMCYGASMWSGIERLVIAGEGDEVEQLTGFDEGPMRDDWRLQFENRGIAVVSDVQREAALATFSEYGANASRVVYNGRGRTKPSQEPAS
jgi:tRNA(Arg) A34 adenosine deaminase TadA